jgi:hypothetical protein
LKKLKKAFAVRTSNHKSKSIQSIARFSVCLGSITRIGGKHGVKALDLKKDG